MLKMNLSNDANTFIEFRFVKRTNNGRFLFVKANFYNTNYCVDLFVDSFSNDVNLIKMGTCSYEKYNSKIVHKILKKHRSYFGHLKDEEYFDQVIDFITPGVLCVAKTNDREPPRVSNCGDSLQFILNAVNSRSNNKKCNFIFFNPLRRRNNILPIRAKRKKKYDFYFVGALRHHKKFKKNFYAIIDDLDVIRGLFPIWKSV